MGPHRYGFIPRSLALFYVFILCASIEIKPRHVLDLILFLNSSAQNRGFTYTSGPNNSTTAIFLEDPSRNLALPSTVLEETLHILKDNSDITFLATVKQSVGDAGSIIAISSNNVRFIEIESSGRRDEIRFHYNHDQQTNVETFPYRLADNQWHRLALTLSGTLLTIHVDCSKIYERVINTVDRVSTAGTSLQLFVGQRNGQHALFRGALQDVKIVTQAHGYLLQCPSQNTACPTCAQYQSLEQQVKTMYTLYQNLSMKLLQAEERLSSLEQCECLRTCNQNGTTRKEGEVWELNKCTVCRCANGTVSCRKVDCPPANCDHPVYRDGECCPVCLTNCFYSGKYYNHGDTYSPRVCVTCTCTDGSMQCKKLSCPPINCPKEKEIHIQGECCPVCQGTDFCAQGNNCHANSTCVNLATRFACQCQMGFQGDGTHCEDINECLTRGGKIGHHCNGNTQCVNTIGSYRCQCASGHVPSDPYSCEGSHVNSASSYFTFHLLGAVILLSLCLTSSRLWWS